MSHTTEWTTVTLFKPPHTFRRECDEWVKYERGEPIRQSDFKTADKLPPTERVGDGIYLFSFGRTYELGPIVEAELREAGYGAYIFTRDVPPNRTRRTLGFEDKTVAKAFERIDALEAEMAELRASLAPKTRKAA